MTLPNFPTINGNFFDWSSIEIRVDGVPYTGVAEISYRHRMEPGMVYSNNSPQPMGRTRGQYKAEGSISIYRDAWLDIQNALIAVVAAAGSGGFMEANFEILVSFREVVMTVQQDQLQGCRIIGTDNDFRNDGNALIKKFDLSIMRILENGVFPFNTVPNI